MDEHDELYYRCGISCMGIPPTVWACPPLYGHAPSSHYIPSTIGIATVWACPLFALHSVHRWHCHCMGMPPLRITFRPPLALPLYGHAPHCMGMPPPRITFRPPLALPLYGHAPSSHYIPSTIGIATVWACPLFALHSVHHWHCHCMGMPPLRITFRPPLALPLYGHAPSSHYIPSTIGIATVWACPLLALHSVHHWYCHCMGMPPPRITFRPPLALPLYGHAPSSHYIPSTIDIATVWACPLLALHSIHHWYCHCMGMPPPCITFHPPLALPLHGHAPFSHYIPSTIGIATVWACPPPRITFHPPLALPLYGHAPSSHYIPSTIGIATGNWQVLTLALHSIHHWHCHWQLASLNPRITFHPPLALPLATGKS